MEQHLSTIVLNWNRCDLLRQTLRSYADTVTGPYDITIVDNASSDGSRRVVEEAAGWLPDLQVVLLEENLGGEALNLALSRTRGDLVHISENDQLFLPGWCEYARTCFSNFPLLGQLSLHGVVPTDDEAWELKGALLRFSAGTVLYEAALNVGTSSIIRNDLVAHRGIRIRNIQPVDANDFRLPDDGKLSDDVKQAGYFCAWSDRYYVRNLGHEITEFEKRPEYYRSNYAAKPVGVEQWEQRIANARALEGTRRQSIVFPDDEYIQAEKTPEAVDDKPSQLWSMFDGYTAEVEVLDFIFSLVRLLKPNSAIETGTWLGRSAVAIAKAMRMNGHGRLTTIEINPESAAIAGRRIEVAGVSEIVDLRVGSSLEFEPSGPYEFALFDSEIPLRPSEFRRFYGELAAGATILFHDTGTQHVGSSDAVTGLMTEGLLRGLFLKTPRGLFVGQLVKPPQPREGALLRTLAGFDDEAYLDANPDVREAGADAAQHFREHGWREGRHLTPWTIDGKRLILTVTPGRSGTGYLANLLDAVPGICALHEPHPKFSTAMREVQEDPAAAATFLARQKLPAMRALHEDVYVETSHLACKGFIEPLVRHGLAPDLIILHRDPVAVATSLYLLDTVPARTALGREFLLMPTDPGVLPIACWEDLDDWSLCFWYCREIERRMAVYKDMVEGFGRRTLTTSIESLRTSEGLRDVLSFLGVDEPEGCEGSLMRARQQAVVNAKSEMRNPERTQWVERAPLSELARSVDERIANAGSGLR